MSQADQGSFFDNDSHDFLQLPRLLSALSYIDLIANVKKLLFRRAVLLCGSILINRLHRSGDRKDPIKLVLIWDTGSSYGLMPLRRDFFHCVKCDIPAKDMNKINRFIGIGTTLHKFIN